MHNLLIILKAYYIHPGIRQGNELCLRNVHPLDTVSPGQPLHLQPFLQNLLGTSRQLLSLSPDLSSLVDLKLNLCVLTFIQVMPKRFIYTFKKLG